MTKQMNLKTGIVWLVGGLLSLGALADPVPLMRTAKDVDLFPTWKTVRDDASAQAQILSGSGKVSCPTPGMMVLPVCFEDRKLARASWDIHLPCKLDRMRGIQFDFYCGDLSLFSNFSLYFKSGDGWYHASFSPNRSKQWQHVQITKGSARVEPPVSADGWGAISAIRLSGWHAREGKTECAIANLAPIKGNPQIIVLRAESRVSRPGCDGRALLTYADTIATTFDAMGFNPIQMADTNVPDEVLDQAKLVIIPYNPYFPVETAKQLKKFVARGGKLLACYSLTRELGELLGVRSTGYATSNNGSILPFIGFRKAGKGLQTQPDFAGQNSWCCNLVEPATKEGTVVAYWENRDTRTDYPAIIRTPNGIFISHVWLGGSSGGALQLMRSVAGDLVPDFWEMSARESFRRISKFGQYKCIKCLQKDLPKKMSPELAAKWNETLAARAKADQLIGKKQWVSSMVYSEKAAEAALQTWMMMQPSVKGEHRAFWCHSAWGMGGKHNWDSSVRFMKENGFTDLIANLSWGGCVFYDSKVLPVHSSVAQRGDALAECMKACQKYGVKCHIWKVCWNMGGYAPEEFRQKAIREKRVQVGFDGTVEDRWLCPSDPVNQTLEINTMIELAEKGVDGVHFDYIRYPGAKTCFCEGCRARFEKQIGRKVAHWPQDVRNDPDLKKAWTAFRVENITKVVRTVAQRVHQKFPKVEISAAVFRNPISNPESVGQDWKTWCDKGWLDFVCPMDYVDSPAMFYSQVLSQKEVLGERCRIYPGLGLSCWDKKEPLSVRTVEQVLMARKAGVKGFTIFNLDRNAEQVLPYLRLGVTKE